MELENENENQPITFKETAIECVDRLRHELDELKRENEHLTKDREFFKNKVLVKREEAFAAFGKMPYLLDWVESIATDKISQIIEDKILVDDVVEEAISDADLISQSDIEGLIEFAIDEAKEESQSIATDKISEIIEDKILEIDWSITPHF